MERPTTIGSSCGVIDVSNLLQIPILLVVGVEEVGGVREHSGGCKIIMTGAMKGALKLMMLLNESCTDNWRLR